MTDSFVPRTLFINWVELNMASVVLTFFLKPNWLCEIKLNRSMKETNLLKVFFFKYFNNARKKCKNSNGIVS